MPRLRPNFPNPAFVDPNPPVALMRELLLEYAAELKVDLCFQKFDQELANLPGAYAEPDGCFLVASVDGTPAGCGAFRFLEPGISEMYIRPAFRGCRLGRLLTKELMARARSRDYRLMRLDTLARMHTAIELYRSLGFVQVPPYNESPLPDCVYFEAILPASASLSRAPPVA